MEFRSKNRDSRFKIRYSRKTFGFTLIELLVVVALIGILATLVMANLNAARGRSRDAQRKSDLRNLETALRLYYNDRGGYPANNSGGQIIACNSYTAPVACSWGDEWSVGTTVYMSKLVKDPLPDQNYSYSQDPTNDTFTAIACLENKSDDKCDKDAGGAVITCAGGSGCQYSIKP